MGNQRSEETSSPARPRSDQPSSAPATSRRAEIDTFLDQVKTLGPAVKGGSRGRLIFALDATMSRQPTWDQACKLQAEMFREAAAIGGLDIQLVDYRGLAECRASSWIADPDRLGTLMSGIDCRGGQTQIAKVLAHARRENDGGKVAVVVFVGDAMEEPLDELCARAGELGLLGEYVLGVFASKICPYMGMCSFGGWETFAFLFSGISIGTPILSAERRETRFSERNAHLNVRIPQESRMHWKKRQKQIQYLQAKHGSDRSLAREFPDLKVEERTAPCSNGMRGRTARRVLPPGMKQFPVGHCHKQGYELIIPGTDLQWMGGKKP